MSFFFIYLHMASSETMAMTHCMGGLACHIMVCEPFYRITTVLFLFNKDALD